MVAVGSADRAALGGSHFRKNPATDFESSFGLPRDEGDASIHAEAISFHVGTIESEILSPLLHAHWSPTVGDSLAPVEADDHQPRRIAELNAQLATPRVIDQVIAQGAQARLDARADMQNAARDAAREQAFAQGRSHAKALGNVQGDGASQTPTMSLTSGQEAKASEPRAFESGFAATQSGDSTDASTSVPSRATTTYVQTRPQPETNGGSGRSAGMNTTVGSPSLQQAAPPAFLAPAEKVGAAGQTTAATEGRRYSSPQVSGVAAPSSASVEQGDSGSSARPQPVIEPAAKKSAADAHTAKSVVAATADTGESKPLELRIEQMMRVLRAQILRGENRAQLRLNPDELGLLKVELQWRDNSVVVRLEAESDAARDLLLKDQEGLRESLQQAGLTVQRIEVVTGDAGVRQDTNGAMSSGHFGARQDAEKNGKEPRMTWTNAEERHSLMKDASKTDGATLRHRSLTGVLDLMA